MNSENIDINNLSIKIMNIDDLTEEINYIAENEGSIVKNVAFPIYNCLYISLADTGFTNIDCGKIIDNLHLFLKQNPESPIIICDFNGIDSISSDFCKSFTKLLLQSKSKIIPINMNIAVSVTFSRFIESNLQETEE